MPKIIGIEESDKGAGGGIQPLQHCSHLTAILPAKNRPEASISKRCQRITNPIRTSVSRIVVKHDAFKVPIVLRCDRTDRCLDVGCLIVTTDHDGNARQPDPKKLSEPPGRSFRCISCSSVYPRIHLGIVPTPSACRHPATGSHISHGRDIAQQQPSAPPAQGSAGKYDIGPVQGTPSSSNTKLSKECRNSRMDNGITDDGLSPAGTRTQECKPEEAAPTGDWNSRVFPQSQFNHSMATKH